MKQNSHKDVGKKTNYGNMINLEGCDKACTQAWNGADLELITNTKQGEEEERIQYQNNAKNNMKQANQK